MRLNWLGDHMMEVSRAEGGKRRGLPSKFFFSVCVCVGGGWPCGGHKGHRPVGYWCLSGIHPQRPSFLIDSHQLTAKHDQWWQERTICWAKGGCRNTASLWSDYCSPHCLFFSLSLTLLHLSVCFGPLFLSPPLLLYLCFSAHVSCNTMGEV